MEKKGVWRTINGRKVFIEEGQSVKDAYSKSIGKKEESKKETKDIDKKETKDNNSKTEKTKETPKKETTKKESIKEDRKKEVIEKAKKKSQTKKKIKDNVEKQKSKDKSNYGHAYDVGHYTTDEMNRKTYSYHKNKEGLTIGSGKKEGIEKNATDKIIYNMSQEREKRLTPKEKKALRKIESNNKKIDRLVDSNTSIYNTKTSRKDWYEKHSGEKGKHTREPKNIEGYYEELSPKYKAKIKSNEEKIQAYREESLKVAKTLKRNEGKYPIKKEREKRLSDKELDRILPDKNVDKFWSNVRKKRVEREPGFEKEIAKRKTSTGLERYFKGQGYTTNWARKMAKSELKSRNAINTRKFKTVGEVKQFLIERGYSEETANKYAQEYILRRKKK